MNIKELIKKSLQDYYKQKLKIPVNNKRPAFDNKYINKTALLFFINGKTDLDLVRMSVKKIRKDNKNIYPIIYSNVNHNVDVITDRDFFICNANSFDYRWQPKYELRNWLNTNNFDLLINFCFEDYREMAHLYSLIQSKLKIGNKNTIYSQSNDLTINIKKNTTDFNAFYNLAIDNLKMLNIKRN